MTGVPESATILECLIGSVATIGEPGNGRRVRSASFLRFADAFLVEAIEAGIVDCEDYVGSRQWNDILADYGVKPMKPGGW